ncbi:helix-turn-helix transcriptional regulator [Bacillus sp. CLL-7-23]|uniref:Helix-turn-helix transcriptional regulator n=1 Tax=Bacillus changyiensis TaxID=3004103 RepID=A0ABT4X7N6_9BACI|nr:helix-turn-helix transcriptional regulator [Bacillus changyiensis]MDA1477307.1 helix-turn-helix transcriptional regulator [Bacillus changyiensis]MDA7027749.1 helix-turn-helix transcriptional regulator [Bacillus changyiensis]
MRVWLKKYREDKGLIQQEVADASKIERAYYTMIENGCRKPSVLVAKRIGKTLDFDWTLFFEDERNDMKHLGRGDITPQQNSYQ